MIAFRTVQNASKRNVIKTFTIIFIFSLGIRRSLSFWIKILESRHNASHIVESHILTHFMAYLIITQNQNKKALRYLIHNKSGQ